MSTQRSDWGHEDFRNERKIPSLGTFEGLGQAEEGRIEFPDQPAAEAGEPDREDGDCFVQPNPTNPTAETCSELVHAFDHLNAGLFGGQLRRCMLTLQRKARTRSYYRKERFVNGRRVMADEIALNPAGFARFPLKEILAALVHEMVHLWQHQVAGGEPGRVGYHNLQWAAKMISLGLMPSHDGKQTGDQMSQEIVPGGLFDEVATALIEGGFNFTWRDRTPATPAGNRSNREKFHCAGCRLNAWAKTDSRLICGTCLRPMTGIAGSRSRITFN